MQNNFFIFIFDSPWQIGMVVIVVVLLFGAGKLPQLAKSLGQTRKAFKDGMREAEEEELAEKNRLSANAAAPQVSALSDEALAEELKRRAEMKT